MKKFNFYVVVSIVCMFFGIGFVGASDDGFLSITSKEDFEKCLQENKACRLFNNIALDTQKHITENLILDLNGHSITADETLNLKSGLFTIGRGGKLTINDSKGTGKVSTGSSGKIWAAIQLLKEDTGNGSAEVVINGGTIEGYYYGITGNGNLHNTKVTINGGTIKTLNKEDSVGIYQPQEGEIVVNNGTIQGGTGIEIRSGSLTVKNGTIEGIASQFIKMENANGTTTNGVGIAVAQHTTKKAINVSIYDGNISGQYAFYEWNPQKNSKDDLDKIHLHIYGGKFTGLATGVKSVYSEDFTQFISGGSFTPKQTEYLTNDAQVTSKEMHGENVKLEKEGKEENNILKWGAMVLLMGSSIGFIFLKRN